MHIPITAVVKIITAAIIFACYLKIHRAYVKNKIEDGALKHFSLFFLGMAIFQIILALGYFPIMINNLELFQSVHNAAYIIGHAFLYLSIAQIVAASFVINFSQNKRNNTIRKYFYNFVLLFGSVLLVISIMNPTNPSYNYETSLAVSNPSQLVARLMPILIILSIALPGILFIVKSIKLKGAARGKSLLIGIGLIIFFIGGPMHNFAKDINAFLFADIIVIVGFIIIFAGVFYTQLFTKKTIE